MLRAQISDPTTCFLDKGCRCPPKPADARWFEHFDAISELSKRKKLAKEEMQDRIRWHDLWLYMPIKLSPKKSSKLLFFYLCESIFTQIHASRNLEAIEILAI